MGILLCTDRVRGGCSYYGLKDADWQDDDWQEKQDAMLQDILGDLEKDAATNSKLEIGSSDELASLEKELKPSTRYSSRKDEFSPREEVSPREERSPEILEVERNLRKLADQSDIESEPGVQPWMNNQHRGSQKVLPHMEDQELYLLYGRAPEAPLRKRRSLMLPRTRRIEIPENIYRRRSCYDWRLGASRGGVISSAPGNETIRKWSNAVDTDYSDIRLSLNRGEIKKLTSESLEEHERQDEIKSPSLEPVTKPFGFSQRDFRLLNRC